MTQVQPPMKLEVRLEKLKEKIKEEDFLKGRGLGNEVPFWIFDYPPEMEIFVRDTVQKIKKNAKARSLNICEIDLYRISLQILFNKVNIDKIYNLESEKGSDRLLQKLIMALKSDTMKIEIQKLINKEQYNLIFLTGVGNIWPILRSHSILNNLQTVEDGVPLVLFYPGKYDGNEIRLFNKFKDANYYRAFQLIPEISKR